MKKDKILFLASILALLGVAFQLLIGEQFKMTILYLLLLIIIIYVTIVRIVKAILIKKERKQELMYSGIWVVISIIYIIQYLNL